MARPIPIIRQGARRGFTLVESLIASVVLATAVVGVAGALAVSSTESVEMDVDARAVALARQLMEEVSARPFDAPAVGDQLGWALGNVTKSTYDNVSDFAGYTDTIFPGSAPTDPSERLSRADRTTYTRSVSFEYRLTPSGAAAVAGDLGLVTVTVVSTTGGTPVVLHRLVSRFTVARD